MIKIIQTKDLANEKFGRLKVLYRVDDRITPSGRHLPMWHCLCDCSKEKDILGWHLTSGKIQFCGCYQKEIARDVNTKRNKYDVSGEYGIGYLNNSEKTFLFDKEDYDKIASYTWYLSDNGYVISSTYRNTNEEKVVLLHRVVMGLTDDDAECADHIDHNTLDNRKSNLRVCTIQKNNCNQKVSSKNTSGITGVSFHKQTQKWRARINFCGEEIYLGTYIKLEDAIKARREAEDKYFGEYSYRNSMSSIKTSIE